MLIPFLLSVSVGVGLWLLYEGLTNPRRLGQGWRELHGIRDFLTRAGLYDVSPRDFLLFSIGSGLLAGAVAEAVLGWPAVGVLAATLGALLPLAYYLHRQHRRRGAVQAALVEAISQLRDAIRTGLSVQEALAALSRSGPDLLRAEFATLSRDIQVNGFEEAMEHMRQRLASPLWDTCAIALTLNDRLGGRNVSQVLDRLAHATRAQLRVEEELRANQAHNVLSARIVASVPVIVLLAVRAVNPRYLTLFSTTGGQLLLLASLISVVIGYLAMLWTSRLPAEPRVLR
ncbi:MAG TPA: type II secretion system F family protein [Chloroflexota bacterium]|nr:type II secretion system F family protein [Chloroflexota bacterium]